MIDLGIVKPGSTIRVPFASFAGSTGASSATTNFAAADLKIFKDGSTTERASTAGFTATADFDTNTGLNVFVIDLADNTTAGFYSAGSEYLVAVADVTVDTQTVRFWGARFVIGLPDAVLNTTIATLASQTSFTLTAGPAEDDALNGCVVYIHDVASAVQGGFAVVSDYTGSTKTVTLAAGTTFTAAASDNIMVFPPVSLHQIQGDAQSAADLKDFADAGYDPATNKVQGVVLTDTVTTYTGNTPQTGDAYAIVNSGTHGNAALKTLIDAIDNFVDTEIADLQSRLPAALVGGRMDSNVQAAANGVIAAATFAAGAIDAASTSADFLAEIAAAILVTGANKLATDASGRVDISMIQGLTDSVDRLTRALKSTVTGTVGAASSTTSVVSSALSPAGTAADQFKGRIMVFDKDTTTAALRGQATDITASSAAATPTLTVTALTTAPASGDTFTIQ